MRILTGQSFADLGRGRVFGADPYENDDVLAGSASSRRASATRTTSQVATRSRAGRLCSRSGTPTSRSRSWTTSGCRHAAGQEAVPRHAVGARGHHRAGLPGGADPVRRALPRPGRGGPADVLRPAAGRLRRAPAHGHALHPPHRRGRATCSSTCCCSTAGGSSSTRTPRACAEGGRGQRPGRDGRRLREVTRSCTERAWAGSPRG